MSYTLTTSGNTMVHRAGADTDCTILIVDGQALALVDDADDDCVGYYHRISDGEYVRNQYDGYSWYVEHGELCSCHGKPEGMSAVEINDGSQRLAARDSDIAELLG